MVCKEVEVSSENALQRLSAPFWAAFVGKLISVFGIDIFQPEDDVQGLLAVDYIACTGGWYVAMEAACREVGDAWFMEWYDALDWMESDEFDCDLMAELKHRVLESAEETRNAYYEWLVRKLGE